MEDQDLKTMLIEYMGRGFLDNIVALFKQDETLYRFIPDMLSDLNLRVRLGTVALVEELVAGHRNELKGAIPGLIMLLNHPNPTVRGDAASLLGTIRDASARKALQACIHDFNPAVSQAAREALIELEADA